MCSSSKGARSEAQSAELTRGQPSFGFSDLLGSPVSKPSSKVERWTHFSGYILHTTSSDEIDISLVRDRLVDAMPERSTAYVIGVKPVDRPKLEQPASPQTLKGDGASYAMSIPAPWADPIRISKKPKNDPPPTLESALKELQELRIKRTKG